jgi:hypothetical protein
MRGNAATVRLLPAHWARTGLLTRVCAGGCCRLDVQQRILQEQESLAEARGARMARSLHEEHAARESVEAALARALAERFSERSEAERARAEVGRWEAEAGRWEAEAGRAAAVARASAEEGARAARDREEGLLRRLRRAEAASDELALAGERSARGHAEEHEQLLEQVRTGGARARARGGGGGGGGGQLHRPLQVRGGCVHVAD